MPGILIASVIEFDGAQLVTLPGKASFPEGIVKVNIRAQGHTRIIRPVQNTWNEFF
jgi:virulence-associated protein VagC